MSKTPTQNEWYKEWKENFLRHISDWSYNSADEELEKMHKHLLADARKEVKEKIEQSIPRYLKGGELRNQYFVKGYNECKQDVLATLREERV